MLTEILICILIGIVLVLFPLLFGIVSFFLLIKKLRANPKREGKQKDASKKKLTSTMQ